MSTPGAWTEDRIRALREKEDLPFVCADASGIVQEINDRFKAVYGWSEAALIGQSLGLILPPSFRDSHHAGFARFKLTDCLLYTSPSPRDRQKSRMPSSA